jgi:hypothetical protein
MMRRVQMHSNAMITLHAIRFVVLYFTIQTTPLNHDCPWREGGGVEFLLYDLRGIAMTM